MSCRSVCRVRPSRGCLAFLFSWQPPRMVPRRAIRVQSPASFVLVAVEVAPDRRRSQKLLDPFRFVESLVNVEPNFGSKFQVNAPRDLATYKTFVTIERFNHSFDIASAERHHVNRSEPQVGADTNLRHGDQMAFDHRIVDVAARQHGGELVTDQLADAQLPLRAAACTIAMRVTLLTRHTVCHPRGLIHASRLNSLR